MGMLGIITGTIGRDLSLFKDAQERVMENAYGTAAVMIARTFAVITRHGRDPHRHILPHAINHPANLKAFKDLGVDEVIAVQSTGSLRKTLKPGMFIVPDDYIQLYGGPTVIAGQAAHITPALDDRVRQKLIQAARDCLVNVVDGGIYWQTPGPRLETKAEIALMARFAHLVGMTMAGEAFVAQELDLPYASLCSIDNYAHGLGNKALSQEEIVGHAGKNAGIALRILQQYIENRRP
jgi:5'-methylthioadenosine phosphorylase